RPRRWPAHRRHRAGQPQDRRHRGNGRRDPEAPAGVGGGGGGHTHRPPLVHAAFRSAMLSPGMREIMMTDELRTLFGRAVEHGARYRETLPTSSARPALDYHAMRERVDAPTPETGTDAGTIIDE